MVVDLRKRINDIETIISNIEKGSRHVPQITSITLKGLEEIRSGVRKADDAIESLQKNFFIRQNLPKRQESDQFKIDLRP